MKWKDTDLNELAKTLGINIHEVREKHRLILLIKKIRTEKKISQASLAKRMNITQGRIAQIESRQGTGKVTFEVLLGILRELGYEYRVVVKKAA